MTYQVGQIMPLDVRRNLTTAPLDAPEWYALQVAPQKETATRAALKARGIHSCFPERETNYRSRGKMIVRKFPIVTRIVYAKFEAAPQWDVLKYRRLIVGVFSYGETPIKIPGDVVRAVMGLPTVAEELEAARREMLRVREGDKARVMSGIFEGHTVDVRKVASGRAWFETLTGIPVEANLDTLDRITGG